MRGRPRLLAAVVSLGLLAACEGPGDPSPRPSLPTVSGLAWRTLAPMRFAADNSDDIAIVGVQWPE